MGAIPLAHIIAGVQGIAPKIPAQLDLPLFGGQVAGRIAQQHENATQQSRTATRERGDDHNVGVRRDPQGEESPLEETR